MKENISLIILFLVVTILYFLGVAEGILSLKSIYLLPLVWWILLILILKLWVIDGVKLLLASHVAVVLSGVFSLILYQLFLKLEHSISIKSDVYSELNGLMLNSDNALYLMVYSGALIFFLDLFLVTKMYLKYKS